MKMNHSATQNLGPPLLSPLTIVNDASDNENDKECFGSHVRGTSTLIRLMKAAVRDLKVEQEVASSPPSTSFEWMNMLGSTFQSVDRLRQSMRMEERGRPGVVLVVKAAGSSKSSGEGDDSMRSDDLVPFVLEKNTYQLPIIVFEMSEERSASTTATSGDLVYSCSQLGTSTKVYSSAHAAQAGLYYTNIVSRPRSDDPNSKEVKSSFIAWGGLFSHAPKIEDFGGIDGSNTANIFSITRAVFRYASEDVKEAGGRPNIVGVWGFDMTFRKIKGTMDAVSEDMGRTSFPILVTPHGDTLYHPVSRSVVTFLVPCSCFFFLNYFLLTTSFSLFLLQLQTKYKQPVLFDLNSDINNYEYFEEHVEQECECQQNWMHKNVNYQGCVYTPDWVGTQWCYVDGGNQCKVAHDSLTKGESRKWMECGKKKSFEKSVRQSLLNGEVGQISMKVFRALPAGDAATEGFDGQAIDTTYYYTAVLGWDIRVVLVMDLFDINTEILLQRKDGPRVITTQLESYIGNDVGKALADQVDGLQFINQENCKGVDEKSFSNCKPDEYCQRVQDGVSHPLGVVEGAPPCVSDSTCECEIHRWPVGLTAKNAAGVHVAPKSLIVPRQAYDLSDGSVKNIDANFDNDLNTHEMTRFLNKDSFAENPVHQKLRSDAIEHAVTFLPIHTDWVSDAKTGLHNDTEWLYYGSFTGMSLIFPPNDWGFLWDPTRRPWYGRAISSGQEVGKAVGKAVSKAVISTPYVDGGGAGLMNTLASIVWGGYDKERRNRKINGVVGFDFLYPVMNQILPAISDCSPKGVRDVGQGDSREIACWLFEVSGLFLTHSDFLATDEEKAKAATGDGSDGSAAEAWPIENVFVGKKEPDIADTLISDGIFVEQSSRTPDSAKTIYYYKVNNKLFDESNDFVRSGEIDVKNSKCLQEPKGTSKNVQWFVSPVKNSNAYLLVVDGYRRKSTECSQKTQSKPAKKRTSNDVTTSCGKQQMFLSTSVSWQQQYFMCAQCEKGDFADTPNEPCKICPPGKFSQFAGSFECTNCSLGMYNEVPSQPHCQACAKGKYSKKVGARVNPCKKCPKGAECTGRDSMEASVVLSDQGSSGVKELTYASYWRDPRIENLTGTPSTCFYHCVEPRACMGTVACSDDDNGVGGFCKDGYEYFLANSRPKTGINMTDFSTGAAKNYSTTSATITTECIETSSLGEKFCVLLRLREQCAIGYVGDTCAACDTGFAKEGTQCKRCMNISLAILGTTVASIIGVVLYLFLIVQTLKGYGQLPREGIVMRVISSNLLIISLFKDLEIQWPSALRNVMGSGSIVGEPVSLLNLECLWTGKHSSASDDVIPYVVTKKLLSLTMPLLFGSALAIFFGVKEWKSRRHWARKKKKWKSHHEGHEFQGDLFTATLETDMALKFKHSLHDAQTHSKETTQESSRRESTSIDIHKKKKTKDNNTRISAAVNPMQSFAASLVVMLYMLYPSLLSNTFGFLECVQHNAVGDETECTSENLNTYSYYYRDQSVRCFDAKHNLWLGSIFVPSIILYIIMIPVVFFFQMRKYKAFIFAGPTLKRVVWGFVTSGYREETYYWELIVLLRKAILVFLGKYLEGSKYCAMFVCYDFLMLFFSLVF